MTRNSIHTKTPWRIYQINKEFIEGSDGELIVVVIGQQSLREANSRHIIRCVNNHEKLIEALKNACDLIHSEYCSHDGPHGKDNSGCYAQEQHAALDHAEREEHL